MSKIDQMIKVCVAIPTYNRENVLVNTLKQVFTQTPPADEIIVVDQTEEHVSETDNFLITAHSSGQIRLIKQKTPNLPAARNVALAATKCDVVIFIDDDVEMPTDFVEKHRINYQNSNIVAVAGRIIQQGLVVPKIVKWPPIMDHRFFRLDCLDRLEGIATFIGCNHSVRVSALADIGGYDTNYIGWAYREDSDVAIRLWKAGGLIVFDPEAVLRHLAIPTGGCRLKNQKRHLPEWQISFPATYFTIRHLFPSRWFWYDLLIVNVRKYIFRRDNILRPWRLPWAILSYLYSIILAAKICLQYRHLSINNGVNDLPLRSTVN